MTTRNTIVLLSILALFAFAIIALLNPLWGREAMRLGLDLRGGIHMVYLADFSEVEPGTEAEAMAGAIAVIERRINILGVTEPVIQKQGADR
ncbi:MAG: protein translocase subunit SecD, partial [Dehalococcoidales bacterium]